jgi:predicted ATP-dependent serine protease
MRAERITSVTTAKTYRNKTKTYSNKLKLIEPEIVIIDSTKPFIPIIDESTAGSISQIGNHGRTD